MYRSTDINDVNCEQGVVVRFSNVCEKIRYEELPQKYVVYDLYGIVTTQNMGGLNIISENCIWSFLYDNIAYFICFVVLIGWLRSVDGQYRAKMRWND